jgi:hypothetical protein
MVMNGERPPRPEGTHVTPEIPLDDLWKLVEACWAQLPDKRPTGTEVQKSILRLQGVNAPKPVTNDDRSSATAETRILTRRKHACQDCDKAFSSASLLNDHIQIYHMNIRECLMTAMLDSS